ncbi:hypothetical protein BKA62DRAFT_288346 [Auriculariales sp. MPI-PUGE-AT-0066]|nr:hypothetical protein BKA62DRAFT_288346 [Auriculariales sp. MPI-PUGE-AT-0066]
MTATDDEGSVSDTDARRPYTAPEHGRPIDRIPVTTAVRIDSISNLNDSSPDTCMLTDSTRTSPSGLRSTPIGQPQRSVPDFTRMLQHAHKRSLPTQPVTSAPAGWVGGLWPSSRTIESPTRDHDWQSFLDAYSQGFWDPRHTPMQPPTSVPSFPFPDMATDGGASTSHSPDRYLTADAAAAVPSSALPAAATEVKRYSSPGSGPTTLSDNSWAAFSDSTAPSSTGSNQPAPPRPVGQVPDKASPSSLAERRGNATPDLSQSLPTKMPLISQLSTGSTTPYTPYPSGRPRLKASSSSPGISLDAEPDMSFEASEAISQRAATAATMRWAGVGVAIAPLALPSPEHELTDPFRHYNKSLPPPTPGEQRDANHNRKRSSSSASAVSVAAIRLRDRGFWEGTQEVSPDMLPPIPGSLQATPGPKVPPAVSSRPSSPILSRKDSRTSLSSRGKQRDYFSLKAPPPPRNPSGMDSDSAQEDGSSRSGRSSPTSVYVTPTAWETPGLVVGSSRPTAGLRPLAKLSGMTTAVPTFKLPTLPTIPSQEAVPTLERTDSIATSATVSSATAQPSHTPQDEDEPSPSLRPDRGNRRHRFPGRRSVPVL